MSTGHRPHLCGDCMDCEHCSRTTCKIGRTKRRPAAPALPKEHDFETVLGLAVELRAHAARIAHFASMAMTEGLGNESLVRDMHDIIGSVGNLQSVASLLEHRAKNEPMHFPRLADPPDEVQVVRMASGSLARRRRHEQAYWDLCGYPNGVDWAQILRWGPVVHVRER